MMEGIVEVYGWYGLVLWVLLDVVVDDFEVECVYGGFV